MRILVLGINHSAISFANCFANSPDNLVFTNQENTSAQFVDIDVKEVDEYREFAIENRIDLTVLCDETVISYDYVTPFEESGLAIFAPDYGASKMVLSRANSKKFMYKNKIQTPKFGVFDKYQQAIEWARAQNAFLYIKSDYRNLGWESKLCETFPKAKKEIDRFFEMNLGQLVTEVAVEGNQYTFYAISDGYNICPLGLCGHNKENSYLDPVIDKTKYTKIVEIARKTISSLAGMGKNYVGILGIDFVIDTRDNLYVIDFTPFFKEIDVDLFTYSILDNKAELINSAITGALLDEYDEIEKSEWAYVTSKVGGEVVCVYGRTMNEAKKRLEEEVEDCQRV